MLVGSLLSLVALSSLLRSLPPEIAGGWANSFHVGFICLWLVLVSRPVGNGRRQAGSAE